MKKRTPGIIATCLLASAGLFVGAGAADAAERTGVISNLKIDNTGQLNQYDSVRVTADWSVTDPAVGDTFAITLPKEFDRFAEVFTLPDRTNPDIDLAECLASNSTPVEITCTLTDAVAGKASASGDLWFEAIANQITTATEVSFTIDNEVVIVALPGNGIGAHTGALPAEPYKGGWQTADGNIGWNIVIPGSSVQGASEVTVSDCLTSSDDTGEMQLTDAKSPVSIWYRGEGDKDWTWARTLQQVWDNDNCFEIDLAEELKGAYPDSLTIEADKAYQIEFYVDPADAAEVGDVYENTATLNSEQLEADVDWAVLGGGSGELFQADEPEVEQPEVDQPEGETLDDDDEAETPATAQPTEAANPANAPRPQLPKTGTLG